MANKTLNTRIVLRNDTQTNWTTNKTKVLLKGEIGLETDTHKYKIGDGSTTWENLTYYMNVPANQQFGLVDDVQVDGTSVVTSKIANVNTINGDYNASTNKLATASDLPDISVKLDKKPDGTNDLISNNKVSTTYLPDYLLGQVLYGGTVNANTAVATLSTNAKTKLGTSSNTITLTNDTTAITGYGANEGIFYIVSADGTFAGLSLLVGDWLISDGSSWQKIDNTDAVTGVKGNAENSYRIGNISIGPDDLDDTSTTNKFVTASEKSTWSGKQDAIDSTHKLSADLVDDTNATNKFVTATDKTTWDGKQDALTAGNAITISGTTINAKGIFYVTPNSTLYSQITTAISNDLLPLIVSSNYIYVCSGQTATNTYMFVCNNGSGYRYYTVNSQENWSTTFDFISYQEKNVGSANAGKILKVDSNGDIAVSTVVDANIMVDTDTFILDGGSSTTGS